MPTDSMPWFWLSFADTTRPKGEQFLGAAVLQAHSMEYAVPTAHTLGVNPGGEVRVWGPLPDAVRVVPEYANRLLSRAECDAAVVRVDHPRIPEPDAAREE